MAVALPLNAIEDDYDFDEEFDDIEYEFILIE